MKIGIQTWGSEGDLRPFLALGHGLAQRGHEVTVVLTNIDDRHYAELEGPLGIRIQSVATPVITDPATLARESDECLREPNPIKQARIVFHKFFFPVALEMHRAAQTLSQESDLLVGHYVHYPLQAAAEKIGKPYVSVFLSHDLLPSETMPPTGFPSLGRFGNRLSWWIARKVVNGLLLSPTNRLRTQEGLSPVGDVMNEAWPSGRFSLVAVSPAFCEPPADWGPDKYVTGFLSLPEGAVPPLPSELDAFLDAGAAPVLVSFGSMAPRDPERMGKLVELFSEARQMAQCRMIVQMPAALVSHFSSADDLLFAGPLPHATLMPRCAAVVHHGGAGTTQSTSRAGVPSIVVPHVADQFFWGQELMRVGVAPAPIVRRKLSAKALSQRIRAVLGDAGYRARSQALAAKMAGEDGTAKAAELIERLSAKGHGKAA